MNSPLSRQGAQTSWTHQAGDRYLATGVDRNGRRFRTENSEWRWISGINLWRGTKWLLRGGRRYRILTVFN